MKRVKQISIDILVDDTVDGVNLADEIADALEEKQFVVMGCGFNEDMTETYIGCYSDLMEEIEQKDGGYFEAVEVCPHCHNKYRSILGNRVDDGSGACATCSVKGCENEANYYVDFDMNEVEFI